MSRALTFPMSFKNIGIEYINGACSPCWPDWKYENINPQYNKFYYFLEGECYLKVNDKEFIAKQGQLFLLPFDSIQTYYHISDKIVTMDWFHFYSPCNGKDLLQLITLPYFINVDDPDKVKEMFEKIFAYGRKANLVSQLRQESCILELLSYYIDKSDTPNKQVVFTDSNIEFVLTYIEEHLDQDLSINELSELLHFHPNYFIRYFKDIMKVSPIEYINNLRIEHAKTLLSTENLTIEEIAYKVGFNTLYYFSRFFKEKTGFTPTDYRLLTSASAKNK